MSCQWGDAKLFQQTAHHGCHQQIANHRRNSHPQNQRHSHNPNQRNQQTVCHNRFNFLTEQGGDPCRVHDANNYSHAGAGSDKGDAVL